MTEEQEQVKVKYNPVMKTSFPNKPVVDFIVYYQLEQLHIYFVQIFKEDKHFNSIKLYNFLINNEIDIFEHSIIYSYINRCITDLKYQFVSIDPLDFIGGVHYRNYYNLLRENGFLSVGNRDLTRQEFEVIIKILYETMNKLIYTTENIMKHVFEKIEEDCDNFGIDKKFLKLAVQAIIEYFEFYENLEKEMRESGSSEKKEKNIEEEIKKFEKKIGEMEKELFKYKLYGETLMANLNKIQKGEKYVVLKNVYNPEETLNIELDETLTPQENAERYFEKYKKIKRGIEKLREKIENLKKKEIIIAKAPLNKEENIVQKEIRKHIRGVRVFTSPNGFKVYVAKGAKTADYLTFKIASPEDYFFHIKDSPGAHVILKCGKQEPSEEDIKFCAELALYYSKKRNSEKGIVSYAKRKYVKKFPEAKPGEVKIEKEKTINVRLNTFFIDS